MKTTLEIPDVLFRKAKATAARQGRTLKALVQAAIKEELARTETDTNREKPWMKFFGGMKHLHAENKRIERLIEEEFGQIEPEDRL